MRRFFFVLGLFGILLITGCTFFRSQMPSEVNFKSGVSELEVDTLQGTPPKTVYPGTTFKMIVQLDNQAAYDLLNGVVSIVGLDPYYLSITPTEVQLDTLEGRSVTSPLGGNDLREFDGEVRKVGDSPSYDANFFIKTKYLSTLEFGETVCLNPSAYEIYDGGCSVRGKTSYSGQGAPLAVAAMEEIISPSLSARGMVEFRFLLKNKGDGTVEFVNFQKAKLGNQDLSCQFVEAQGDPHTLQLGSENDEGVLVCTAPLKSLYSYTTTLNAVFTYGYELQVPQRITIVDPTAR